MSSRFRLLHPRVSRLVSRLALTMMLVALAMPTLLAMDGARSTFAQESLATPAASEEAPIGEPADALNDPQDAVMGPSPDSSESLPGTPTELPSETDGVPDEDVPPVPLTDPEAESVSSESERQAEPAVVEAPPAEESGSVTITLTDQFGTPLQGILIERPAIFPIDSGGAWGFTDARGQLILSPLPAISFGFRFQPADLPLGCSVPASQNATLTPAIPDAFLTFVSVCDAAPPLATGSLTVQMMDQDSAPLVGGEFQLIGDGAVVETWSGTGRVLVLRDLPLDASYTVHQVAAPAGCVVAADQSFTLTLALPSHAVAIINDCTATASEGEVVIYKLDQYFTRRGGAEFQLIHDGTVVQRGTTTPLVGEVIFSGLSLDTPYTVNELEAPLGCIAGPDQTFTLTSDQPRLELIVPNECAGTSGSITITKTDQFGNVLADVEFQLLYLDGTLAGRGFTEADGTLSFVSLYPNVTYTVNELSPPEGCIGADNSDVALTLAIPDRSITIVNECEDATPSPTPTEAASTPTPIPTEPVSTPVEASTPVASSSTGTGSVTPGTLPSDPDGSNPATRDVYLSTREGNGGNPSASMPAVNALPNTGQGATTQGGYGSLAMLAVAGSLVTIGAGMRLRRI